MSGSSETFLCSVRKREKCPIGVPAAAHPLRGARAPHAPVLEGGLHAELRALGELAVADSVVPDADRA
eukprot:5752825-Alexandrium_andersonii.AAC.1